MGCINSKSATVVQQLTRDKTDSESTHDEPEDLAVSEATDSGVAVPVIFWDIPAAVPPLSSESFTASSSEEVPKETDAPVVLQQERSSERPKPSEILEELISPGIVPVGRRREAHSWTAYNIASNKEALRTGLRKMSAPIRLYPMRSNLSDEDSFLTDVQPLRPPELSPEQFSLIPRGSPRGEEWTEKTGRSDSLQWQMEGTTSTSEEEEVTLVEEHETADICEEDNSCTSD